MVSAPIIGVLLPTVFYRRCWVAVAAPPAGLVVDCWGKEAFISRCIFSSRVSVFVLGSSWVGCSGLAASAMSCSMHAELAWATLSARASVLERLRRCFLLPAQRERASWRSDSTSAASRGREATRFRVAGWCRYQQAARSAGRSGLSAWALLQCVLPRRTVGSRERATPDGEKLLSL